MNEITTEQLLALLARYDDPAASVSNDEIREYEAFMGVKLSAVDVVEIKLRLAAMLKREGRGAPGKGPQSTP